MSGRGKGEAGGVDIFDLNVLRGVGDATREKLGRTGVYSLLDLAVASPRELAEAGIGEETASNLCLQARTLVIESGFLDGEFIPATGCCRGEEESSG